MKKTMFAAMCSVMLLAACSNDEGTKTDVKPAKTQQEEVIFKTPFTGEQVTQEATQRPVLVTINNHPDARPQSGIATADVVYEMLAEGDVTRLLALYQSELPESIGPVRSARSYFVDVAKGLDAFYIAHGYSPEAKDMLTNRVVDNINGMNYDGTLFKRSADRVAPHNSYFPTKNLEDAAEAVDASLLYSEKVLYSFYEQDANVRDGSVANNIRVNYSQKAIFNSEYQYDATSNLYTRSSGQVVTTDDLTDEPVQLSNVLFFEMAHQIIDNEGRRDIDITSGGKAYVAQQGQLREVRWANEDGLLVAIEEDGSQVQLVPGQTWVHFVPTSPGLASAVTYSE